MDPTTGTIDMDLIQTGISAGARTARAQLTQELRTLIHSEPPLTHPPALRTCSNSNMNPQHTLFLVVEGVLCFYLSHELCCILIVVPAVKCGPQQCARQQSPRCLCPVCGDKTCCADIFKTLLLQTREVAWPSRSC